MNGLKRPAGDPGRRQRATGFQKASESKRSLEQTAAIES
jgi:hypothetical protein